MKNAINRALAAKKNYSKYICLFLMLLGACAHAWGAETLVATFDGATLVTSDGYGATYGGTDWYLSMGGGGPSGKIGFNKKNHTTIGDVYGTSATSTHDGFYIRSKNKLDNICKLTFTYGFCSTYTECEYAKIYLSYSTDGSTWNAVTGLTTGTQGMSIAPSNTPSNGYNETIFTFEFPKINSAYYAIVISRNGSVTQDQGFAFSSAFARFYSGCCEELAKPTGLTVTQNVDGTHGKTTFSWNSVTNANGYLLSVTKDGTTTNTYDRTSGQLSKTGTLPAGNYTWSVYAKGTGDPYCVENPAQDGTPFCVGADLTAVTPSGLSATPSSTSAATISWSSVSGAEYYEVEVKVDGGATVTSDILDGTSWNATGLSPNTTYRVYWKADNICDDAYNSAVNSSYTFTITAHTVQFNLNGKGSGKPSDQTVLHGGKATTPSNPTPPEGWGFAGWYKEEACTNAWNFGSDVVNADVTLYAKWTEKRTLAVASVADVVISATSPSVAAGSSTYVTPGTTVTLNHGAVTSPKSWAGWNVYKTGDPSTTVTVNGSNQFTMPDYNVTVSAFLFGDLRAFCEPPLDATLVHKDAATDDSPLKITSAAGQKVKAIRLLTLTITGASGTKDVTLSGTDLLFYKTDGTQITGSVLQTTSGSLAATDIVVAYAPSAYVDENFATPSITVTCDGNTKTFNGLVTGRCLPDEFVIAAKAGSEWVALTAKITGSGTQDAMPIRVDNTTTPTKASVAMNTSEYQLLGLPTTNSRYASNGIAVHLYSTQSTKVLNASTSSATKTHINTYATHANAATSSSCLYYEWKLISSDLVHYTVTNSNENASLVNNLVLGYSTESGKWGMYTSDKANQDIFLLPITEVLTDMDVEVMEWGTSSMVLRFAETPPSSTIKVTLGGSTSDAKTLTNINSGSTSDLYKVEGLTLSGNNCEVMQITDGSDATKGALIRKPILVNTTSAVGSDYRTALTDEVCASCDIVILNGGKLTADQDKDDHTSFANIHVYPGGKLVLDGYSLGAKQQVYARGGYSWLNLSTYALPELYIKGTIKFNGSAKIIYDYYIQNYKYYQFCLPYTVALNKVTDEADVADFPAWIKHYDGSLRAANSSATSWAWYNGTNFEAGVGYIVAAKPRQVTAVKERPLSIIRFPLTNNAFSGTSTADYGEAQKSVATTAHGIAGYNANPRTVTANNVGWNFVGNPYMATWKGDIGHNQLVENKPDGTHWDGSYKWVDAATKYITVMSAESGHDYEQYVASNTELKPFFPFYFQETASGGSGTLTFTLGNRIKKAPTRMRTPEPREAFVQIDIERNSSTDQTGFLISDKYSNDIDFDDMEKQFGSSTSTPKVWLMHDDMRMAFEAMTEIRAAGFTPLGYRAPENGDYVLSINSGSNLDDVAAVYLNDNVENVQNYNLLEDAYEFSSDAAVYNDTRFTVRIVMKENTATGLDELQGTDLDKPQKFLHEGRMYIIYKGFIWDATGKKVKEINK